MRVTTYSKKESLRTGKILIDRNFYRKFPTPLKIQKRCKNPLCRCLLPPEKKGLNANSINRNFCDKWCREMVLKPEKPHLCKYCGRATKPLLRVNSSVSTGQYRQVCDSCSRFCTNNNRLIDPVALSHIRDNQEDDYSDLLTPPDLILSA